ncbi:hypothetical protein JTE90_027076 [Oedothorax gibbosus]|uniref:Uncharacterized protein n=1 Tax=Oedothorax gibbosus TaxID=931172 RepID=A0AAV6UNQ5_9ARAC|nr:hypothetical protein JTE90_027076 [Oedothorax gibbosus]
MEPIEFQKFTTEGYFTIRRSDKFWSGIWSDMTIEQTLMKNRKSSGGLTRGRGITDSLLTRLTMGLAALKSDEVENYCSCLSATTDQHIDTRRSRIRRDDSEATKLSGFPITILFPTVPI